MGVAERQIELAEAMGGQLILLFARAVAQLPAQWQPQVRRALYAELKALPGAEVS
jgi:hypothetical protein